MVPPAANKTDLWPLTRDFRISGKMAIAFSNGTVQTMDLMAILSRPALVISPTNWYFGKVHTKSLLSKVSTNKQTIVLRLANPTSAEANWKIVHIPRHRRNKEKSSMDPKILHTFGNAEFDEKVDWKDEADVFVFSQTTGKVRPQHEETITVTFRPKADVPYNTLYRFVIPHGVNDDQHKDLPLLTVDLTGHGTYEEVEDHDYDHSY